MRTRGPATPIRVMPLVPTIGALMVPPVARVLLPQEIARAVDTPVVKLKPPANTLDALLNVSPRTVMSVPRVAVLVAPPKVTESAAFVVLFHTVPKGPVPEVPKCGLVVSHVPAPP